MPDLNDYPKGKVTIVFTDIEGSSKLTRRLESRQGIGVYESKLQGPTRERLMAEAGQRQGHEIQRAGDGHMLVFQSATDALACVVAFQRSLRDDPIVHPDGEESLPVKVRIGVHTTRKDRFPVLKDGRVEYPGDDTNFAARVGGLGQGGQILLSDSTVEVAESLKLYTLHPWPNRLLKSFEDRARTIHEVLFDEGQTPIEPGLRWLPEWFQKEKKRYIERADLERRIVSHFKRQDKGLADSNHWRNGERDGPPIVSLKAEGGMGKTQLALQCAAQLAGLFEDGVFFVSLAVVSPSQEAVAEAIGLSLGLSAPQCRPEPVLEHVRKRNLLLILDNYESVDNANLQVARFLIRIISEAHRLRLLITGRSAVNVLDVEQVVDLNAGMTPEESRNLFLHRIFLRRNRTLNMEEETQVSRILAIADYCPYIIEQAAGWSGHRELKEIADGLEAAPLGPETELRPGALRLDSVSTYGRHDSLKLSFDWSYDLLGTTDGEAAQILYATCGLFADTFDAATLSIIADDLYVQKKLDRLLDVSLIRRVGKDGKTRYTLHRFSRDYARHRLDTLPSAGQIRSRFVAYYVKLVTENARDV